MVPGSTFRYSWSRYARADRAASRACRRDGADALAKAGHDAAGDIELFFILYASNSQFPQKQNTDGIVPPRAQNVKNETFTKIKRGKTQLLVEPPKFPRACIFFLRHASGYAILGLYPPPEASASGGLFFMLVRILRTVQSPACLMTDGALLQVFNAFRCIYGCRGPEDPWRAPDPPA